MAYKAFDRIDSLAGRVVDGELQAAWIYKDDLNPIAELDGDGNVVARYVYGSRANVPDAVIWSSGPYAGQVMRYVVDHLGSVRALVSSGAESAIRRYGAWGNSWTEAEEEVTELCTDFPHPDTGDLVAVCWPVGGGESEAINAQPFGFAGGMTDPITGWTRFGARDYDPLVGRWTASDPIRFEGGTANLYEYVGNDPANGTDPTGLYYPKGAESAAKQVQERNALARLLANRFIEHAVANSTRKDGSVNWRSASQVVTTLRQAVPPPDPGSPSVVDLALVAAGHYLYARRCVAEGCSTAGSYRNPAATIAGSTVYHAVVKMAHLVPIAGELALYGMSSSTYPEGYLSAGLAVYPTDGGLLALQYSILGALEREP